MERTPITAKDYERPTWEEVEDWIASVTSIRRKVECLENFLACDKEHVNEGLLESLKAEQGKAPFRVKLRLGIAYFRACEKADIPPLLKVSTIVRNLPDALLPRSVSEDVRTKNIALAKKERGRVYRRVAEEALQELRQRYEEKQSKSGWLHALQHLRLSGTASSFCCGDALLELINEELRKHPDNRPSSTELGRTNSFSRSTPAKGSTKEDTGRVNAGGSVPTRRTKERVVIAHRIAQDVSVSIKNKDELNSLLSQFILWLKGKRRVRPIDPVWDAIGYAPGRGKGDIEEALELLHKRVEHFEKEVGERAVENIERLVKQWLNGATALGKNSQERKRSH